MTERQIYETPTTLDEVRDYVLGKDGEEGRSSHLLLINVEHSNLKVTRLSELRMDERSTVDDVKQRLYLHTGTRPASMRLYIRSEITGTKRELRDERLTLLEYGLRTGDTIILVDEDPFSVSANGWLEDTSLVPKYKLSDEAYAKKENTYRKFKQKMREKDPTWSMTSALARQMNAANKTNADIDVGESEPEIKRGDRVEVFPGAKRGEVMFIGRDLEALPSGWWVGIKYDEPVGKNDGCLKGVRYFDADRNHGGLVRPSNVKTGDFPPLDLGLGEDDDIDEV